MNDVKPDLPLNHDTILETVVNRIRQLILERKFKPGERLPQNALAERFGVSRTPIREALHQLEKEGLVTNSPYKGASVVALAEDNMLGIYHVRIALESYAARLAVMNITQDEITELRGIVAEMHRAYVGGQPEVMLDVNRTFYLRFYSFARQPQLYSLVVNYLDLARMYRQLYLYQDDLAAQLVDAHEALLKLIAERDAERVAQVTREDLEQVVQILLKTLQDTESDPALSSKGSE